MVKYAILINSCDAYSDVWDPFFRILEKTWPEAGKHPIYLNTETKDYKDSFFNVQVLNCVDDPQKTHWGKRLLDALNRIEDDKILLMLEDFFFEAPVKNEEIDRCAEYLEQFNDISIIGFTSQMECLDSQWCEENQESRIPGYVIRKKRVNYKFNAGPSMWRKKVLQRLTFKNDTPWEWEFYGNRRTWYSNDNIYGRIGNAPTIFLYDMIHGGAVHRGKWTADSVRRCIEMYNLNFDLSFRGVEEENDFNPAGTITKPFFRRLDSVVKNTYLNVISLLYGSLKRG